MTQLPDDPVDIFLAGVAGRSVTPHYWERILPRLDPRLVVPTHYDDFFAPLGRDQKLIRRVDLAGVPDEVAAVSRAPRSPRCARRRVPTTRLTRPVTGPPAWAGESYLLFSFTASTPTRKRPRLSSSAIRRVTFLPAYLLRLTP